MSLEKNITKIYAIKFFAAFLVMMPVIVPFFQSTGIGMKGVYILQSVFAIVVFIAEVPSGYVSDMLGRKKTFVLATFLKAVGFSIFPFSDSMTDLVIAEVVLGIGMSLSSGTDTALLYDTLEVTNPNKAHIKVFGRSLSFFSLGEGLASLIASGLIWWSFGIQELVIISAITSWIPFLICLSIIEPPRKKMANTHRENLKYIYQGMFQQSRLLNLILLNAVFSFSGTLIAVWLFQKYWERLGVPLIYFGFLWATANFIVSYSSRKAHKWEKQWGSVTAVVVIGLLPVAGYLGISLVDHLLGAGFCFLFQYCRGIGQVIFKDALNKRVTADFRATANSVLAMGTRLFFAFVGPLVGWIIDRHSLSAATLGLSIFYSLVFVLVLRPLIKERHNFIPIR